MSKHIDLASGQRAGNTLGVWINETMPVEKAVQLHQQSWFAFTIDLLPSNKLGMMAAWLLLRKQDFKEQTASLDNLISTA